MTDDNAGQAATQGNTNADAGATGTQNNAGNAAQGSEASPGGTTEGGNTSLTGQAPEGAKAAPDAAGAKAAPDAGAGAPEVYIDFTLPQDFSFNKDVLSNFSTVAKEFNLSQDNAQKLINLSIDHAKSIDAAAQAKHVEQRNTWVQSLKDDVDFGGEKYSENLERAKRAVRKFGSPGLTDFLNDSGFGDHPELIKIFTRIDRITGETKTVDGQPPAKSGPVTAANTIYPNQGKQS